MRLISSLLMVWNVRHAQFELSRAAMLMDCADAAQDRAKMRLAIADRFSMRAGLGRIPAFRR